MRYVIITFFYFYLLMNKYRLGMIQETFPSLSPLRSYFHIRYLLPGTTNNNNRILHIWTLKINTWTLSTWYVYVYRCPSVVFGHMYAYRESLSYLHDSPDKIEINRSIIKIYEMDRRCFAVALPRGTSRFRNPSQHPKRHVREYRQWEDSTSSPTGGTALAVSNTIVQFLRHYVILGTSTAIVRTIDVHQFARIGMLVRPSHTLVMGDATLTQTDVPDANRSATMIILYTGTNVILTDAILQEFLTLRVLLAIFAHGVGCFQTSRTILRKYVIDFTPADLHASRALRHALVILFALVA